MGFFMENVGKNVKFCRKLRSNGSFFMIGFNYYWIDQDFPSIFGLDSRIRV